MQRPWWLVLVLAGLIAASAHSDEEALEGNRRLLEKWRADKERYKRLQDDLRAFCKLPPRRQEQLRRIDRELHEADPTTQVRLWTVLDRYRAWLDHLPEAQRQKVLATKDPGERLVLIRALRWQQWIDRQPVKVRAEVMKLPPDRRAVRVGELQRAERAQKRDWMRGAVDLPLRVGSNQPAKLTEFPVPVQKFVADHLMPRLTPAEKEEMQKADGKWPDLARIIHQLADRHPVLPPGPWGEIKEVSKLWRRVPAEAWGLLKDKHKLKQLGKLNGKWPEFALLAAEFIRRQGKKTPPLGASQADEFPEETKIFLVGKLLPSLTSQETETLRKLEGLWPEYPKRLLELARLKQTVIPGMSLPGPHELWQASRAGLPDAPGHLRFDFARNERTAVDRAGRERSPNDFRGAFEKLRWIYFKRKPHSPRNDRGQRPEDGSKTMKRAVD